MLGNITEEEKESYKPIYNYTIYEQDLMSKKSELDKKEFIFLQVCFQSLILIAFFLINIDIMKNHKLPKMIKNYNEINKEKKYLLSSLKIILKEARYLLDNNEEKSKYFNNLEEDKINLMNEHEELLKTLKELINENEEISLTLNKRDKEW